MMYLGLKDSIWKNAIFHVTLYFSEHYNEEPPEVVFNTIPYHPNGMTLLVNCLATKDQ